MKFTMGGSKYGCNGINTMQLHPFEWNQNLKNYVKDGQLEKAMQLFQKM
jgi:hypothetical protein